MHNKDYIGYLLGSIGFVYLISLDITFVISLILAFYISYYVNKSIKDSDKKLKSKKIGESFKREKGIIKNYENFFNSFNPPLTDNQKIAVVTDKTKALGWTAEISLLDYLKSLKNI